MSRSTCKLILGSSVMVLLLISAYVMQGQGDCSSGMPASLSRVLSLLSLAIAGISLSYMNRSLFMVSSDRITVALLYFLIVLSVPHILSFSVCHVAAVLSLASFFYMLRFLNEESMDRSDYFLSAMFLSCSAALIPQIIWLLIPGMFAALSKGREERFRIILITVGAMCIPLLYILSYLYVFSEAAIIPHLMEWFGSAVHICLHSGISAIGFFYSLIVATVIVSVSVSALAHFDTVRSSTMRKKLRYILAYTLTACLLMVLFDNAFNGPAIMIPGITFSLLLLRYGDVSQYGRMWRHLFFMLIVACVSAKAYLLI